jgi:hypothetical protein
MKKSTLLLILLFFSINIFAQKIEAKYDVTYGKFLKLGVAKSTLITNNDTYKIKIEAVATGLAKILSNNRVEIYESYGKIIEYRFVPDKFVKIKKDKIKKRVRTYTFDRKNKKILIHDVKSGKEKKLNDNLKYELTKYHEEDNSTLDYYAEDDILSLFFNMHEDMLRFESGEEYTLNAVGANKTKGVINILMPSSKELKKMDKVLKTNDKTKFTAFINQRIFQSKRGELLISLNDYGFCSFAVLKDVLLFGDIVGKMTEFKIKEG